MDKVITEAWPTFDQVFGPYLRAIFEEAKIRQHPGWQCPVGEEIYKISIQLLRVAQLNLVPRSFCGVYDKFELNFTPESVGGHTNLVLSIVLRALRYIHGPEENWLSEEGYTLPEIIEAVMRHDQPEARYGDIADNGTRDEQLKHAREAAYLKKFASLSPRRDSAFECTVSLISKDMASRRTPTGRLLFLADKAAAIIMALAYDKAGYELLFNPTSQEPSARDRAEIELCQYEKHCCSYASEMWTADYFAVRELVRYDDCGYITALLIMCTLLVNGEWYAWHSEEVVAKTAEA